MAQFYGAQSKYLLVEKQIGEVASRAWFIMFCVIVLIVAIKILTNFSILSILTTFLLFGPLMLFADAQAYKEKAIFRTFKSGLTGETKTWLELHKLNDNYIVFQDIVLPGHKENIDFVVVGPTGIFTIEVKNHFGYVDFNSQQLIRNGKLFEKDFLTSSMYHQALPLHEYIFSQGQLDCFVQPIIVFTHGFARVRFGMNLIHNILVIQRQWLVSAIMSAHGKIEHGDVIREILLGIKKL